MPNTHIFTYLDYYVDLPRAPHYAVMLTGPWGIGKSFHIKRYLKSLADRGKKVAYVSLYGVKSADDIAMAVFTTLVPKQDNKLVQVGSQIGRALLKKMATGAGETAINLLPDDCFDLLVLDDLERAVMSHVEVLGFVNSFIEHEDRRIVLIANEAELPDQETYRRVREKVIGMTFVLAEETDAALTYFIDGIDDPATREFLRNTTAHIRTIFDQSKTQNLRLLDQSLRAWERLYKVVDPELKKKKSGIDVAFNLFLALSLEVRAGRIIRSDLIGRINNIVAGMMKRRADADQSSTPMSEAQDRYGRLQLHDDILTDEVLIDVLCDGKIDETVINAALAVNQHFVEPGAEPAWRKVWHGFLREAAEFEPAFQLMEQEFKERKFDDTGIVLHVFGLRLWGAELGEIDKTDAQIVTEGKAYIDDLRHDGRLKRYRHDGFHDSSHGLGLHHSDTPAFKELRQYLIDQSEHAHQAGWPKVAAQLLDNMSGEAEVFYSRVCWSGGNERPDCADDPVLATLAVKDFVDRLIAGTPVAQRTVLEALKTRYERGGLANDLATEAPWLIDMHRELTGRIPSLPRIRQYSLTNDTKRLLDSALRQANSAANSAGPPTSAAPGTTSPPP